VGTSTGEPAALGHWWDIGRAPTAIYGTIISASVLAAAYGDTAVEVAAGVFVTLLVYWLAERWSELIAGHLRGEPFTWAYTRQVFVHGWPMVQASYGPMLVLIIATIFGLDVEEAVELALVATVLVLLGLGAVVGRKANLPLWGVFASAGFVGLLGALLILLKSLLH